MELATIEEELFKGVEDGKLQEVKKLLDERNIALNTSNQVPIPQNGVVLI